MSDAGQQKIEVVDSLCRNRYNSGEGARRAALAQRESGGRRAWEGAARKAGVVLRPPREVTIYSDETLRDNVKLNVPRQLKYVGNGPIIPSSLADTLCSDLGLDGMLQQLNDAQCTKHTLDRLGLSLILQSYIDRGYDFGRAYGSLRFYWLEDFTKLQQQMDEWEATDRTRRIRAVESDYITDLSLPPRRAWDLCSNRVLPWWLFRRWYSRSRTWCGVNNVDAVSHSWVEPSDRLLVSTPINNREWPVPIPSDTTLDRIRVELLNLGRQVVWLDVLCLRQEGSPEQEALRMEEWKLDVPTIGNIYQSPLEVNYTGRAVTYFNGLGRPFRVDDLDHERHWLNRAWTFQEFDSCGFIGGLTPESPFAPRMDKGRVVDSDPNVQLFYQRLQASANNHGGGGSKGLATSVLSVMRLRHAAHIVDKVGGLTHVLAEGRIPLYLRGDESDPASAAEDAWNRLISVMADRHKGDLFWLLPAQGNGKYTWCPSWQQIHDEPVPQIQMLGSSNDVVFDKKSGLFKCWGHVLAKCAVQGLAEPNSDGQCRSGRVLLVRDYGHRTTTESFAVAAHHQVPIPDGTYVLSAREDSSRRSSPRCLYWVVGHFDSSPEKRFEKLSVLRTEDAKDISRIKELGLVGKKTSVNLM